MRETNPYINFKKEEITSRLNEILYYYGCTPGKSHNSNWNCSPSRHNDPTADLSVRGGVCCCHCGLKGDGLNVIKIMEGFDNSKDGFFQALKKGYEILNEDVSIPEKYKKPIKREKIEYKNDVDFSNIINENFKKAKRKDYQYFYDRGITRDSIFLNIKPIVGLPLIFPHENTPQLDNIYDYNYIIPVWKNGKVVNAIMRRNDKKSTHNKKVMNLKNIPVSIFGTDLLNNNEYDIIVITEGIFDCLSFLQYNISSISINSAMMYKKLNELIESKKENCKNKVFVLALDNDIDGQKATRLIRDNLNNLGIKNIKLSINKKYKDINDYLVNDKKSFELSIEKMMTHCEKLL